MSDITTFVVDLLSVAKNVDIEKKDGGTYKGTVISYMSNGKAMTKSLHANATKFNPELASDLNTVQPGKVRMILKEKDGFKNLIRLTNDLDTTVEGAPISPKATTTVTANTKSSYDPMGPIKGNSITNGVNIAISMGDTSFSNILKQAKLVLSVHTALDQKETETKPTTPTTTKTPKTVVKSEDVDDTDLF